MRWLKYGEQLDVGSDANLIMSNDASLIISQSRITDSGNYSCLAENIAARRRSDSARLTVYGQSLSITLVMSLWLLAFSGFYRAACNADAV